MQNNKNERGIAIIIVIAIMVALVMLVVALLSTVTMQSDTARAYKQDNIVLLGAVSAKAMVVGKIATLEPYYAAEQNAPEKYTGNERKYYLVSPYTHGESIDFLDAFKPGTPAREKIFSAKDNVLAGFDKSLMYVDVEKSGGKYAEYDKIDPDLAGKIFYTLRYDYRVLALDRTTIGTNATADNNTVIDLDSVLYADMGRGLPVDVDSNGKVLTPANYSYGVFHNNDTWADNANTGYQYDLQILSNNAKKVFA